MNIDQKHRFKSCLALPLPQPQVLFEQVKAWPIKVGVGEGGGEGDLTSTRRLKPRPQVGRHAELALHFYLSQSTSNTPSFNIPNSFHQQEYLAEHWQLRIHRQIKFLY